MPIPLPNLDNRTFADLVEEMRALIPRYAPQWTDHNLSDPGIMLIDLFAWLTEALIYRLNRIPQASEARFLELLGARFQPAQPATGSVLVTASGLTAPLGLVRGTPLVARIAGLTDPLAFEIIQELELSPEAPGGVVSVRQCRPVVDEVLGVSSGKPHQVFWVRQPPLAFSMEKPDRFRLQVTVSGQPWQFRQNLLESGPEDRHFTLEPRLSVLRFGDGHLGQIPPPGAQIQAAYLTTRGAGGNIGAGTELFFDQRSERLSEDILQAIQAGAIFSMMTRTEATDGRDPTSPSEARKQVHGLLAERWRAITAEDFEKVAEGAPGCRIARAKCVPERDLTAADPDSPRVGHVSIIIVPETTDIRPTPTHECLAEVSALLEKRRLITCRPHVLGPEYTALRIDADIVRNPRIGAETVLANVRKRLADFFHPLTGGPPESHQEGWPFGRDVYISEVYHILEETDGVDYVDTASLFFRPREGIGWTAGGERVEIAPRNLVHFDLSSSSIMVRSTA